MRLKPLKARKTKKGLLKNNSGMTLIEIMIVLVILGGLMAFLGTSVMNNFKKAKVKETKIKMAELGKALEMYYSDCGFYPGADQGLDALLNAPSDCSNWGPDPYIKKNLLQDSWNAEFIYELDGSNYVLRSLGADRKEGGSGVDSDISSSDN